VPSFPLSLLRGRILSRWCSGCDWTGLSLRPPHEHRASDGRVHLRGGFKWGSDAAPPSQFFTWQGEEITGGETEEQAEVGPPAEPSPTTPPSSPPFQWREEAPPQGPPNVAPPFHFAGQEPPPLPFRFADKEPPTSRPRVPEGEPPPLPFVFADQVEEEEVEEEEDSLPLEEEPPRIPFQFADGRAVRGRSPNPSRIRPRLGFRWKG